MLRQQHVRLLSLVGAPGIGKSRLAEAVAAVLAREFLHGAVLVDLARVRQQSGVGRAVAEALRAKRPAAASLLAELVTWMRGRQMLLVLNNFEHLKDSGLMIARLLEECPRLRVVVTSRAGLRLPGEQRLAVQSPEGAKESTEEAVASGAAPGARRPGQPGTTLDRPVVRQVGGLCLQPAVIPEGEEDRLFPLTRREQVVATLLALGFTNAQIAEELVISYRTAETHACRILRKLGLTSRSLVVNWALERGLVMVAPRHSGAYAIV
jgi:DNA-binding CsgD family transcriptional regulator